MHYCFNLITYWGLGESSSVFYPFRSSFQSFRYNFIWCTMRERINSEKAKQTSSTKKSNGASWSKCVRWQMCPITSTIPWKESIMSRETNDRLISKIANWNYKLENGDGILKYCALHAITIVEWSRKFRCKPKSTKPIDLGWVEYHARILWVYSTTRVSKYPNVYIFLIDLWTALISKMTFIHMLFVIYC